MFIARNAARLAVAGVTTLMSALAFATAPAQAATFRNAEQHISTAQALRIKPTAQMKADGTTVCGSGYNTIIAAQRFTGTGGTPLGDVYSYTNGKVTGPNYEDKQVCAAFFNDLGVSRYMKITFCDNYTADKCAVDSGNYSSYAGPVYQNRGYCGTISVVMNNGNTAVINGSIGSSPCN
ncbi:hypothetical protein K7472_04610 [Streptomyces sp. PTM05]|uniref:Uncharacterized protein n=1 Tax=Streptantibioticus parmotrematis TaxID=2873249 RepID=A0ABS7QLQ7_9ACTN|nr:hypothetical protein [Streptantibioticus parmotrematis]MBY8884127.1 hypothetical protein [Streptantibioticus parmotrematis]